MGIGSLATIVIILVIFFFGMGAFTDAFDEFFEERENKDDNRATGNTVTADTDVVCDLRVTFGVEWDLDRQSRFSNLNPFPGGAFWYTGAWSTTGNEKIVTYDWFNCKEIQALSFLDLFPTIKDNFTPQITKLAAGFTLPETNQFTLQGKVLNGNRDLIDRNDNIKFEEESSMGLDIIGTPVEEKITWVVRGVKDGNYLLSIDIDNRSINNMGAGEPIKVVICGDEVTVEFENKTFKDVWLSAPTLGDFVFFPQDITVPVAVSCRN